MTERDPAEELGILNPNQIPDSAPRRTLNPPHVPPGQLVRPAQPPAPSTPPVRPQQPAQHTPPARPQQPPTPPRPAFRPPHYSAATPGFNTADQTIRQHEQYVHLTVVKKLRTSFDLASAKQFEQSFDVCEQAFFIATRILKDPSKSLEITRLLTHLSGLLYREKQIVMADKVARLAINLSNDRPQIEYHLLSQVVLNISKGYNDQNHIFSAISLLKRGVRVVENNMRVENRRSTSRDISRLLIELSNCYLLLSIKANNKRRQSLLRWLSREFFDKAIYLNVVLSGEWSSFTGFLMFPRWVTLIKCELKEEAQQLIALKNHVQSRKLR